MNFETELSEEPRQLRPSSPFLVILNTLILLAFLLPNLTPFAVILYIPGIVVFMAVSGVWQLFWFFLNQYLRGNNAIRCMGFILPALGLVAFSYFGPDPIRPINQQHPAISESGEFKAIVSAKRAGWTVEIQDENGSVLHKEQTEFVSHLSVYWLWGPNNHFWIYNSDDGGVHYWAQKANGGWKHVVRREIIEKGKTEIVPPKNLFPDYAK